MPIYKIENQKLLPVRELSIDLERNIQRFSEENLYGLFGLQFVSTEFRINDFRIDTLAFDEENQSFVIIEYKRDRSFSVIDQGFSYLSSMFNDPWEFVAEYNKSCGKNLKKDDIDWSQSRVIFVAQSFTQHQLNAIGFKDLPIELWEVKLFDNDTILYNQVLAKNGRESIKTIMKDKVVDRITKEIKVFSVQDHLEKTRDKGIVELFESLQERLLELGSDVKEVPKKFYIAYKRTSNFVDVILFAHDIRLTLNLKSGELNDPKKLTTDFTKPKKGHWGNGDYELIIHKNEDLVYAMTLIEQAYQKSK